MYKYLELIPDFQKWMEVSTASSKDDWQAYQFFILRVAQMVCQIDIVWPEFVEKEGLFLRKSNIPSDWVEFKIQAEKAGWSESDMEYAINHVHVADLFFNDPDRDKIDNSVYFFMASTMVEMWKSRLKLLFPKTNFAVGITEPEIDPEVYAYAEHN
ncbi:MAG: hypothetical protein GY797_23310 [Deltaproteobacteria bacterium]|nr:hypothetical protein [Deltaproteobacteria bacterium]